MAISRALAETRLRKRYLDTEAMLQRLAALLSHSRPNGLEADPYAAQARDDAESLRRISMTLRAWHEAECNGNIQREGKNSDGRPHWCSSQDGKMRWAIPDREAGARKRLVKIMARYPSLQAYVQTDPRGCALYILKPGDVPEGADVSAYYSRGLGVYR